MDPNPYEIEELESEIELYLDEACEVECERVMYAHEYREPHDGN